MSGNFTLEQGNGGRYPSEAYFACSTVLNGETYVFGGMREPNQVM